MASEINFSIDFRKIIGSEFVSHDRMYIFLDENDFGASILISDAPRFAL